MSTSRRPLLRQAFFLSLVVVLWNIIEGIVAVTAGLFANSVVLISFGIDSSIEVISAIVIAWRVSAELQETDSNSGAGFERRASRLCGALLFILSVYIVVDAGRRLLGFGEEAQISLVGIALTSVSLVIMPVIGWKKLQIASALRSKSMRADAYESIACAWLSLVALIGLLLNAVFAWTWADPLAALAIIPLIVREALEAWEPDNV